MLKCNLSRLSSVEEAFYCRARMVEQLEGQSWATAPCHAATVNLIWFLFDVFLNVKLTKERRPALKTSFFVHKC